LHEVRDGPANQSYGLAVAQLAGVSSSVVKRARSLLTQLEERALGTRPQLDLFVLTQQAAAPLASSADFVRDRLLSVDPDAMSPNEAHKVLEELKQSLKNG
jgi:DNA mismatch repair protein MutS